MTTVLTDFDQIGDIAVTVLLDGGHEHTIVLPPDAPLLQQLFELVIDRSPNRPPQVIQLPIQNGQAMLCFPGDRLVGLVTNPPIVIQPPPDQGQEQERAIVNDLVSSYVQLDHFLTEKEQRRLLEFVIRQEKNFVSTSTSTGDLEYRKSVVLHNFPEFADLISRRIQAVLPDVFTKVGMTPFPISQIEAQLTGHNDGNYYKIHNDNGSPDTATREFTYVYYFYREPRAFTGGELRIYDSKIENNYYVQADTHHTIEPRNNSIIFFHSRYLHEVLPICCPSRKFADSRFTINGWIRR
ncbi:MAG: proline hydroxylase [Leptolyngbyaceae cyanobacterium SM1_3_5]|nr:proline hydroxylase [Leptolyngbyaceae cyanobacterium SM1_3_5]